jgi:hypothetical protein
MNLSQDNNWFWWSSEDQCANHSSQKDGCESHIGKRN